MRGSAFWRRALTAAASGVGLGFAFPPFCQPWAAFLALVPFLWILDGARDSTPGHGASWKQWFGVGWFFGFAFFFFLLSWIGSLTTERMTFPALRWPAAVAASAYLACYPALFAVLQAFVSRRLGRRGLWAAPFLWTLMETARGAGVLGFPWGALGYGLLPYPTLVQAASLGGVDLLTLWVSSVSVSLVVLARSGPGLRRRAGWGMATALLVAGPWAWGAARIPSGALPSLGTVGLVQPCERGDTKWDPENRRASFGVLEEASRRLFARGVDLVVWPETAVPLYLRYDPEYYPRVLTLARESACPLLIGFPDAEFDAIGRMSKYNAAGLIDERGSLEGTYWKMHLVPFGETIPWQDRFSLLQRIDLGEGDYAAGREPTLFHTDLGTFSVLICFESIFPRLVRSSAGRGVDFLVNITNDDWFGDTPAAPQHAAMAILRAVECGVSLVRCANSGISGVVDPYGRVVARTPLFVPMETTVPVPAPLGGRTLYRRTGDLVLWVSGVLSAVALGAAWGAGRLGRRKGR